MRYDLINRAELPTVRIEIPKRLDDETRKIIEGIAKAVRAAIDSAPAVDAGLEAAQPKWISVEERLPERHDASAGELVLCICVDGDGKPCAKEIHAWHYSVVRRMAKCFTHWMPLPEPPKED